MMVAGLGSVASARRRALSWVRGWPWTLLGRSVRGRSCATAAARGIPDAGGPQAGRSQKSGSDAAGRRAYHRRMNRDRLRRGLRDRVRAARLLRDRRHLLGRREPAQGCRPAMVHGGRRTLPGVTVRADRRRVPARSAGHRALGGRHRQRGSRPGRHRLRRGRQPRVALTRRRALDRPDGRGAAPGDPDGVQDRPGGRRQRPRHRPRPGPAADRRAVPSSDPIRLVAAAVRHPARGRSGQPHRRHHSAGHPGRRRPARHPRLRPLRSGRPR
jgi:hypothetical protein